MKEKKESWAEDGHGHRKQATVHGERSASRLFILTKHQKAKVVHVVIALVKNRENKNRLGCVIAGTDFLRGSENVTICYPAFSTLLLRKRCKVGLGYFAILLSVMHVCYFQK